MSALDFSSVPGVMRVRDASHLSTWSSTQADMIPLFQETLAGGMSAQEFLDAYAAGLQEGYDEYAAQ